MSVADYLSLVRIPLGFVFVFVVHDTALALGILAAAGISDVLDGWVARRQRAQNDQQPHRGDWLDPLCDKIFVSTVVVGIFVLRQPPLHLLALMLTREILQTLTMVTVRAVPRLRHLGRGFDFKAHPVGKATTIVQFITATLLLLGHPAALPAAALTALLAVASLGVYLSRLLRKTEVDAGGPPPRPAGRAVE